MEILLGFLFIAAALIFALWLFRRKPPARVDLPADEHYRQQRQAVIGQGVTFRKSPVMNQGEYALFRAALGVTGQQMPRGPYPYYVFPQVSLGEILRTEPRTGAEATAAYRAINSKRCDLLLADRAGNPVAVLEYQGSGHYQGMAAQRDDIKRQALERAGVRYVEIHQGTSPEQLQQIIRQLLTTANAA